MDENHTDLGQHFLITVIVRERGADFWSGGACSRLSQAQRAPKVFAYLGRSWGHVPPEIFEIY